MLYLGKKITLFGQFNIILVIKMCLLNYINKNLVHQNFSILIIFLGSFWILTTHHLKKEVFFKTKKSEKSPQKSEI